MTRGSQGTRWCYTINLNRTIEECAPLLANLAVDQPLFVTAIFGMAQFEFAPTTGRLHVQGFVVFPTNVRGQRLYDTLRAAFEHHDDDNPLSPCVLLMKGSIDDNINYIRDDKKAPGTTRLEHGTKPPPSQRGKRTDLDRVTEMLHAQDRTLHAAKRLRLLAEDVTTHACLVKFPAGMKLIADLTHIGTAVPEPESWFAWQAHMVQVLSQPPHPRQIWWVYDEAGNNGKSFLASYYLGQKDQACLLSGKLEDMKYAYAQASYPRIVFFDIPRSGSEHADHYYGMAENLKDGHLTVNKYSSMCATFARPHVVFLANHRPNTEKWTKDRLQLVVLKEGGAFEIQTTQTQTGFLAASGGNGPEPLGPQLLGPLSTIASSNVNPFLSLTQVIDLTQDSSDEE